MRHGLYDDILYVMKLSQNAPNASLRS